MTWWQDDTGRQRRKGRREMTMNTTERSASTPVTTTEQQIPKPRPGRGRMRRAFLAGLLAMLVLAGLATYPAGASPVYTLTRQSDPARTVVTDAGGAWVATFTDGARTVALAGPSRTF